MLAVYLQRWDCTAIYKFTFILLDMTLQVSKLILFMETYLLPPHEKINGDAVTKNNTTSVISISTY